MDDLLRADPSDLPDYMEVAETEVDELLAHQSDTDVVVVVQLHQISVSQLYYWLNYSYCVHL